MAEENFQKFYTEWIDEQKHHLDLLIVASKTPEQPQTDSPPPPSSPPLSVLVSRTVAHYEKYYATKSKCAKSHVLLLLSPPWTTQLEDAFIWVGGWRPTAAFHLLYSKSGIQFEAKFAAVGDGAAGPLDLADLSSEQLSQINKLHTSTIAAERIITEKIAKQQEGVADAEMVELSQGVFEPSRAEQEGNIGNDNVKVESALKSKEDGFEKILQSADELRLGTLKAVIGILSPIQAVHFLVAAAELHLRLHEWGREREEREAYERTPCNAAAPPAPSASTAEHITTN